MLRGRAGSQKDGLRMEDPAGHREEEESGERVARRHDGNDDDGESAFAKSKTRFRIVCRREDEIAVTRRKALVDEI